jgi:hypothetical protein
MNVAALWRAVTYLPERLMWTGLLVVGVVVVWALMARGYARRAGRHDLPVIPPAPEVLEDELIAPVEGTYVSTTTEGDWLDRVVAHGLGARSEADVHLTPDGMLFARRGAPDLWIPREQMQRVRREAGMAGKFVEEGGLIVVTWAHGPYRLDTGFRARRSAEQDRLYEIVKSLAGQESPS